MGSMGTIDSIYKEEYCTLICTKYESYRPCGSENFFFFFNLTQSFPNLNDASDKILIAFGMVLEIVIFESVNG